MLEFSVSDRVGTVTIKRPEAGNAVTGEMARKLGEIMRQAAQEADIVTLIAREATSPLAATGTSRRAVRPSTPSAISARSIRRFQRFPAFSSRRNRRDAGRNGEIRYLGEFDNTEATTRISTRSG